MLGGLLSRITKRVGSWFSSLASPRSGPRAVAIDGSPTSVPGGEISAALQCSAVWACCRILSQSISTLPASILEPTTAGRTKALDHTLYRVLTRQPNPLMTYSQWMQTSVLHLALYGNAFSYPERVDGEVIALWPLLPERMRIMQTNTGQWSYRMYDGVGKAHDFAPGELVHFRIFSLDGMIGLSPIEYHRLAFEIDGAARLFAANLYANGGKPSGVLEYPGSLKAEQFAAIRASWQQQHGGPMKAGGIAVLDAGTKYHALTMPPEQLEFISQQRFSVEQIARIYGVPPHLIGANDKPTYASVEQQQIEFVQYTLLPIVTTIERTLTSALLEDPYYMRINLAGFERSDISTRYKAYATARQWGFMSVNDIRTLEDMNTIGEQGDVYLTPLNMAPALDASGVPTGG